jgi:hypothetical protein
MKVTIAVVLGAAALWIAYLAGAFMTSFDNNMCYAIAIGDLTHESTKVLKGNNPERTSAYQSFVEKLPLNGYETYCRELAAVIERYVKEHNAKQQQTK